ncbi:type II and III secretion system protein family protein [Pseudohalocynthiibacter sp. F2068]|jgi:pilus assembly protein CpaC|uniref:type II and III secretion system protein family protein n=1 Tax=Pseudohalocynthiibacter sp. F2068 TaxID=2926418 RepID=UPI001FF18D3C|nr:type II and III secretion system protein family protein [Pseudohalocynthiibacter sp. F2068]MCK0101517.1 type II and III secretion system protein family protein [Pseudohalocynthiibacter sp. F2068]
MIYKTFMKAALLGLAVSTANVTSTSAETLQVMRGAPSSALNVPMNRAVVVESDTPFAELSIANPGIADISTLSDRTIYVLGKLPGRTTLTLLGGDGRLITNVEVHVTPDVAEFKERLRQILPGERVEVRTANDGIVLSGTVSSIARLDRALDLAERYAPGRVSNLMSVGGTQQVMLSVRFAEMQRSVSKELSAGINISNGGDTVRLGRTTPGLSTPSLGGSANIGIGIGSTQLTVLLEALESRGVVRTLAEPNLTALSGQEATFLAGGEIPIPVPQEGGVITVEYKPFGVQLNFTPRVVDGDVINLSLLTAVSSIDTAAATGGFDAFRRRETSTTVELRDGESFAIAGLLQDDFRDTNSQVPWLGDLPILGALFRSADYARNQSELVIIVTAHLVTPTRGEAYALPTDRVHPPTEAGLFLFGQVAREANQSGGAAEVARQDFDGSYGYVME